MAYYPRKGRDEGFHIEYVDEVYYFVPNSIHEKCPHCVKKIDAKLEQSIEICPFCNGTEREE